MVQGVGSGRVKAHAEIRAEPDGHGGVRMAVLRSQAPLLLRRTPDAVFLVGGAAGPLGGDDLRLHIQVCSGAVLQMRSVAASLAQPDPAGRPSDMSIEVDVAAGGALDWAPEPLVLTTGAHHRVHTSINLHGDAALRWRDVTVLGRHDEQSGLVEQNVTLTQDGEEVLCQQHAWGQGAPEGWSGPAVLAGARVVASEIAVRQGPASPRPPAASGVCVLQFAPDCQLTTCLGSQVPAVVRLLDASGTCDAGSAKHPSPAWLGESPPAIGNQRATVPQRGEQQTTAVP